MHDLVYPGLIAGPGANDRVLRERRTDRVGVVPRASGADELVDGDAMSIETRSSSALFKARKTA